MQRRQALFIANYGLAAFKSYQHRDQLPIVTGAIDGTESRYADYSLDDAWRLRLHLDLIGNEPDSGACGECGLSPSGAKAVVMNALMHCDAPLSIGDAYRAKVDIWLGVVVYHETFGPDPLRFTEWFKGDLAGVNRQIAETLAAHEEDYPRTTLEPVRVMMVNASRAARFVVNRAREFHLAEIADLDL